MICAIMTTSKRRNIVAKVSCLINLKEDDKIVIDNKKVKGIKSDDKITFKDDGITVTIMIDNNKIMMKRVKKQMLNYCLCCMRYKIRFQISKMKYIIKIQKRYRLL